MASGIWKNLSLKTVVPTYTVQNYMQSDANQTEFS